MPWQVFYASLAAESDFNASDTGDSGTEAVSCWISCCQLSLTHKSLQTQKTGLPWFICLQNSLIEITHAMAAASGFWSTEIYVRDRSATWSFLFVLGFSWTFPDAFSSAVPGCLPSRHHLASPWHKEARPWICTDAGRGGGPSRCPGLQLSWGSADWGVDCLQCPWEPLTFPEELRNGGS